MIIKSHNQSIFLFFLYLFTFILSSHAQNIIAPKNALPYTKWQMRIIEVGPTRDFYGSITHITFTNTNELSYQRDIHIIRGQVQYTNNANHGEITLFNLPYTYTVRDNILYYQYNNKEVALLKRLPNPEENEESPSDLDKKDDAILDWLQQNAKKPETMQIPVKAKANNDHQRHDALDGSYWQLVDFSNTHLITSLAKELNLKPKNGVYVNITSNGQIVISATVEASGKWSIGDQHIATIILSYTDTGWNRVIGKDRLIKLELKTFDGNKNLFHIMSDDGRSLYPVTIRRMGDENPSYAYVNRTHVFSQLEHFIPEPEE